MKKVGLIICCYNRTGYLKKCLESVKNSDLTQISTVMIVDDFSNDPETRRIIDEFDLGCVELIKCFSKENRTIKGSLLFGLDILFNTCQIVTNLDGDAIVSKNAFNDLLELYNIFPGHIITGFNCATKNKDGSIRHKILEQGLGWNKKYSVGGINMMFGHMEYLQVVKPALQKCLKQGGNWDHQACIISNEGYGKPIIVLEPSCVQHIGVESSMGHSTGGEPPDVADDFISGEPIMMGPVAETIDDVKKYFIPSNQPEHTKYGEPKLQLPQVTLVAADDNIDAIIKAADISCRMIEFGAVKLLSSKDSDDPRAIKIRHLGSKKEYSQFILKELAAHIQTPFAMVIQHDGYIIRPEAWTDEFLNFDAVGAVWDFREHKRTCNGGCCIRSKRIMDAIANDSNIFLQNDHIINNYAEDHVLFYIYREYLEKEHELKIAPEELCNKFSIESWGKKDKRYKGSFGFHGYGIDFSEADLVHKPY